MKTIAQQLNIKEFPFEIRDENGNLLYHETTSGFWFKAEYDSNGQGTYFENSNEYWVKREFNSRGNPIYVEDSTGLIYDNRPKPCEGKLVEVDGIKYKLVKA